MAGSNAATTNVASSATNVTLFSRGDLAAFVSMRTIFNDSTAILYVKFGPTAAATSYTVQLAANAYYEFPRPVYAGQVDGIWASANGNARLTEW